MKNKIILSLVASALIGSTLSAQSLEDRLNHLEETIVKQQKTINDLTSATEDIEEIDERLEVIETRSFTDKIQFGLGMRVEMNNFDNKYADGKSYKANEIWRTKVNLNMKAKITNNLKFTGKLTMYKNWGDSTPRNMDKGTVQGRRPDGSQVFLERAYLDWSINPGSYIPLTATIGRQPSSDGPSYQFKEDSTRKGTYDALAFDAAVDGAVLTANMSSLVDGLAIRYAYATANVQDQSGPTEYYGADNKSYKKLKVNAVFVDKVFNSLPFENLPQAYFVSPTALYSIPSGKKAIISTTPNTPVTVMPINDINIGDLDLMGAMFEASNINGNIDFFFHYTQSKAKPNGKLFAGKVGLLTSTAGDTKTKTGQALWVGTRYSINKDWKIGAEYNKGSKNWFSYTGGSADPLNKLATRGDAVEVYITKSINKYANIRVGYVGINNEYTGSGIHLGKPTKISEVPASMNGKIVKETKNVYVTFNVLF